MTETMNIRRESGDNRGRQMIEKRRPLPHTVTNSSTMPKWMTRQLSDYLRTMSIPTSITNSSPWAIVPKTMMPLLSPSKRLAPTLRHTTCTHTVKDMRAFLVLHNNTRLPFIILPRWAILMKRLMSFWIVNREDATSKPLANEEAS